MCYGTSLRGTGLAPDRLIRLSSPASMPKLHVVHHRQGVHDVTCNLSVRRLACVRHFPVVLPSGAGRKNPAADDAAECGSHSARRRAARMRNGPRAEGTIAAFEKITSFLSHRVRRRWKRRFPSRKRVSRGRRQSINNFRI